MTTHVQIRNLSKDLHRKLKVRAASRDMSITDYVKQLLEWDLNKPTLAELGEELRKRPPANLKSSIVDIIREDRESH
jgi:plasmid stability protein